MPGEAATYRLFLLSAILIAVFILSFALGRYGVSAAQVVRILIGRIAPIEKTWTAEMETVVVNIRLPRIFMASMVGMSLSAAGAAYQGVFQNPMASPDILGASSGAAFGTALFILMGFSARAILPGAFAASLCAVGAACLVARCAPGLRVANLILAGVMIGSLLTAGISYVKLVADPSDELPKITYWLMGSLSGSTRADVAFALFPMALGLIPLFLVRWQLNLLALGDEEAQTLGVNVRFLRVLVIACATLVTAASVSVSGMIGWVGLVVPHLCRKLVGSDYRSLMPASLIAGAAFLLVVDDVSRTLRATEIPIGILTALIGAPFFLYLLVRWERVS
jgi:iron complex transport system permease protein